MNFSVSNPGLRFAQSTQRPPSPVRFSGSAYGMGQESARRSAAFQAADELRLFYLQEWTPYPEKSELVDSYFRAQIQCDNRPIWKKLKQALPGQPSPEKAALKRASAAIDQALKASGIEKIGVEAYRQHGYGPYMDYRLTLTVNGNSDPGWVEHIQEYPMTFSNHPVAVYKNS